MQNTYGQIDAELRVIRSSVQKDVRLRANEGSGEECQTHHYQQQSTNGDKFQTEKLGMKNQGQTIVIKP